MKCPECENNHKFSVGMRCRCGYRFVLNPKSLGISDNAWLGMLRQASGNGDRYYTKGTLWANQKSRPHSVGGLMVVLVVVAILSVGCFFVSPFLLIGSGFIAWLAVYTHFKDPKYISWEALGKIIDTWQKAGREMPNYISSPSLTAPPEGTAEDIYDYGTERILVVDDQLLVDYIVLNKIHADERCAVIAVNGYPQHLKAPIETLIQERPDIPVFLLHAATESGERLATDLPPWLAGATNVTDLGFSKADAYDYPILKRARDEDASIPLTADLAGPGVLAALVGLAFVDGMSLAQAHQQQVAQGTTDSGSLTGYG